MPGEQVAAAGSDAKGGYYTPIAGEVDQGFTVRPIFYGMFLANQLAGCTFKPSTLTAPGVDATAYAAQTDRQLRIALFNKDPAHDLKLSLTAFADAKAAKLWRLTGPALDATIGTTLAGAEFSPDVSWKPVVSEAPALAAGQIVLTLPRNSGALLFLEL